MENSFCFMMVAVATMLAAACSINDNCHRHQSIDIRIPTHIII